MNQIAWNVYLNGKLIDTVFSTPGCDAKEMRTSLIDHDGFSQAITIRKRKKAIENQATIKNKQSAQLEAEKRWGNLALAWIIAGVRYVTNDQRSGNGQGWRHFVGHGKTWDEAFADADKRLAEQAANR